MSFSTVRTRTGAPRAPAPQAPAEDGHRGLDRRLSPGVIAFMGGAAALAVAVYQLSLPNVLTGVLPADLGYDDGVYTGAAIRLVHGVLPYRDFVFVHPPGITYLLAPFAALGLVVGSHVTAVLDRCLAAAVVVANPILAGWLVKPLGRVATFISAFALALWPLAVAADRGVELEPFVAFFCLLGAVLLFSGKPASRWRLAVAGTAFGFALLVEVWAIFPIAAALLVWSPRWNRGAKWLLAGLAVGIIAPSLPFLIAAPHAYFHDVIMDQLVSKPSLPSTPFPNRLLLLGGAQGLSAFSISGPVAIGIFAVGVVAVVMIFSRDLRKRQPLEWFALLLAVITFLGMLGERTFFDRYAYFSVAMATPLLGVCGALVQNRLPGRRSRGRHAAGRVRSPTRPASRPLAALGLVALLGLVAFLLQQDTAFGAVYLSPASAVSSVARYIPPGSCVLFDYPGELIAAGRFTPSKPNCPAIVDPFGMFLNYDSDIPHLPPPRYPVHFEDLWFQYLQRADVVLLHAPYSDYIAWSGSTESWFSQHFFLERALNFSPEKELYIYRRVK